MGSILEEKLREASCIGDLEAVEILLTQKNVNVNSQNSVNGWTPLHWACHRGNEQVVKLLLTYGADKSVKNLKNETASDICKFANIRKLFDLNEQKEIIINHHQILPSNGYQFVPNYRKYAPLNSKVELFEFNENNIDLMPKTVLASSSAQQLINDDELVLKIRIHGSADPDFIEIEIAKWRLTYNNLLKICCEELEISDIQLVERIRKLPNTRLRKDNDVKRLKNYQDLELVLKNNNEDKSNNCYQSITTCKDQTILY